MGHGSMSNFFHDNNHKYDLLERLKEIFLKTIFSLL